MQCLDDGLGEGVGVGLVGGGMVAVTVGKLRQRILNALLMCTDYSVRDVLSMDSQDRICHRCNCNLQRSG